jgi:hypothetical protein
MNQPQTFLTHIQLRPPINNFNYENHKQMDYFHQYHNNINLRTSKKTLV